MSLTGEDITVRLSRNEQSRDQNQKRKTTKKNHLSLAHFTLKAEVAPRTISTACPLLGRVPGSVW